jgi:gamma-glutamylcyclotransferase (GGCT)/AIG2-like uncharacterized protein YtfP
MIKETLTVTDYEKKIKLFCYGTIQEPAVQLEILGRTIEGKPDSLDGFVVTRDFLVDGDLYPRLLEHDKGCVYGTVYEFTEDDIKLLDEYETKMYHRYHFTTRKGIDVQVYSEA